MPRPPSQPSVRTPVESLYEYGRGLAGGLLFSLPLLYTMEVWWTGHTASPARMIAAFAATLLLLLGYNRYAGLHHDATWLEVVIDSIEELGIGLLVSACMLWLLGRITLEMGVNESLGKILMESIVVAVGVSVGTAQLGGSEENDSRSHQGKEDDRKTDNGAQQAQVLRLGVLGVCGAVLVAGNVAPTEEIMMIASEVNGWRLLGIAVVSMFLCALVMYFSEFRGSGVHDYTRVDSVLGVSFTYCIALVTSALLLLLFDGFGHLSNEMRLAQTVVLGLPASLGASAGRLLLQQ